MREQHIPSLGQSLEVRSVPADVRVGELRPHAPRLTNCGGVRINLDAEKVRGLLALHAPLSGGVKDDVRAIPAARPLPAMTSAILREASSIISSPSIAAPLAPPAAEVYHS